MRDWSTPFEPYHLPLQEDGCEYSTVFCTLIKGWRKQWFILYLHRNKVYQSKVSSAVAFAHVFTRKIIFQKTWKSHTSSPFWLGNWVYLSKCLFMNLFLLRPLQSWPSKAGRGSAQSLPPLSRAWPLSCDFSALLLLGRLFQETSSSPNLTGCSCKFTDLNWGTDYLPKPRW